MRGLAGLTLLLVLPSSLLAADLPACTRMHELGFPRPIVEAPDRFAPAPGAPAAALPDGPEVRLATRLVDLAGNGTPVPVEIWGVWQGAFDPTAFPRSLRRPGLWAQDLPFGLTGTGRVEDVDGDGPEDLVFDQYRHWVWWTVPGGFQVFWGQGDGPLLPGWRAVTSAELVGFEDRNGDGLRDAVVRARHVDTDAWIHTVYPADSPRAWDEGVRVTPILFGTELDQPGRVLEVGDLDHDGLDDALALTSFDFTANVAFARGDGTFDLVPVTGLPQRPEQGRLGDLDGDGHLDLLFPLTHPTIALWVAWGHGDRTFEPPAPLPLAQAFRNWELADVTGDGRAELVIEVLPPAKPGTTQFGVIRMAGRQPGAPTFTEVPWGDIDPWHLADLDANGREDLVYTVGYDRPRLLWRYSLGNGMFGWDETRLVGPLPGWVQEFEFPDLDLDGVADLHVLLQPWTPDDTHLLYRNDGWRGFELRARASRITGARNDLLLDVDDDGRPDLVSFREQADADGDLVYPVVIRRGDGLGGLLPPEARTSLAFAGRAGRFRVEGTVDLLRVGTFGHAAPVAPGGSGEGFQLELLPSAGWVHAADVAPPSVELRVEPAADPEKVRLATLPVDECASAPRVTRRLMDLLPLGTGGTIAFREGAEEVLVAEDPATGRRAVLLRGREKAEAISAFRAAQTEGGYPFRHMEPTRLSVGGDWGPPVPEFPGMRLVQRFVPWYEHVLEAEVHRPGTDLTFTLTAHDGVREGVTKVALADVRP